MHILLFILIFIIAIFVFGLSIVGFILRTIFGLGRGSSSSRPKQTESGRTSQQDYSQRDRRSNDDEEEIYSENADSAGMIKNSSCKFQCIFTAGTGS